jgi:radical SAM enzyme (TIGR01210 family)
MPAGVKHLKLYNSGSFFDPRAIPEEDYEEIASILEGFETVIVECHPKLISPKILKFRNMLKPELQIAMGLETVNDDILRRLNKKMTLSEFRKSAAYLISNSIPVRAFILIRTPYMTEEEGIYWAEKSIDFAFENGVECCIVIPVRPGNGVMDLLMQEGHFTMPQIESIEKVLEYGISLGKGRVFADTWDLGLFSKCEKCLDQRVERLTQMNLTQKITEAVKCDC